MRGTIRSLLFTLVAGASIVACNGRELPTAVVDRVADGVPIAVLFNRTESASTAKLSVYMSGADSTVSVSVDASEPSCQLVTVTGVSANGVVELAISRSGNPYALCTAAMVHSHYEIRATVATAGTYQVRVIDAPLGQPARELGRQSIVLTGAAR